MKKVKNNNLGILIIVLSLIWASCQEPTTGCLDVNATNFDVTVDNPCEDACCTYPFLVVQAEHLFDTDKFSLNKKYKIENDSIEFLSFQFYLSDFQLIKNDNTIATTVDSVLLYRDRDSVKTLRNFILAGKNIGFDFSVGRFDKPATYAKIKFQLGLNADINKAVPSRMPSDSPLSTKTDSMYIAADKTYIFNKIVFTRKSKNDTVRITITTPQNFEFVKNLSFKQGFDATIPLKINYLRFFKGVDFSQPQNVIKQKIVENTASAFYVQ